MTLIDLGDQKCNMFYVIIVEERIWKFPYTNQTSGDLNMQDPAHGYIILIYHIP